MLTRKAESTIVGNCAAAVTAIYRNPYHQRDQALAEFAHHNPDDNMAITRAAQWATEHARLEEVPMRRDYLGEANALVRGIKKIW